jgi:hypothetical protein
VVADFHRDAMKAALRALTAAHESGGVTALLGASGARRETSWLNYTTVTHTAELCLQIIARDGPGRMPKVRFELMRHMCP